MVIYRDPGHFFKRIEELDTGLIDIIYIDRVVTCPELRDLDSPLPFAKFVRLVSLELPTINRMFFSLNQQILCKRIIDLIMALTMLEEF